MALFVIPRSILLIALFATTAPAVAQNDNPSVPQASGETAIGLTPSQIEPVPIDGSTPSSVGQTRSSGTDGDASNQDGTTSNAPPSQDYLRDNFGIPEQLSDCDKASNPVSPEMSEQDRRNALVLNEAARTTCQINWQAHQRELEDEKAQAAQDEYNNMWMQTQNDIASGKHPPDYTYENATLSKLIDAQLNSQNKPVSPNAQGLEGVRQAQAMAAQDPDQAAIQDQAKREAARGGVLQMTRDQATKIMIFNRELNALQAAKNSQGWIQNAADSLADFIPFWSFFSHQPQTLPRGKPFRPR